MSGSVVKRIYFILVFCSLLPGAADPDEQRVGNGGDPLEVLVFEATDAAAIMVLSATADTLPNDNASVRAWILEHRRRLATDVTVRKHQWIESAPWSTCMRTNVTLPDFDPETIYFLRSACHVEILDADLAARLLIHESVHHFGILDEDQANTIAGTVYLAWRRSVDLATEHWESRPTLVRAPQRRGYHTAVWSAPQRGGSLEGAMIVWGGCHESETSIIGCGTFLNSGGLFFPAQNRWEPTPDQSAPAPRALHTAVWTGEDGDSSQQRRMIIWGGCSGLGDACDVSHNDGGALQVLTPSPQWHQLSPIGAPRARVFHSAVWTGDAMIIWGGLAGYKDRSVTDEALADGAAYSPTNDTWTALPSGPLAGRREHSAVWTGSDNAAPTSGQMIVWGGCGHYADYSCETYFSDGAVYRPSTGRWTPIAAPNDSIVLEGRRGHTALWTGQKMVIWGGEGRNGFLNSGATYDPQFDTWEPLPALAPDARAYQAAVWTGTSMLVWGGVSDIDVYPRQLGEWVATGGNSEWFPSELRRVPVGSRSPTAVWTGESMIIWGGETLRYTFLNTGGTYLPGRRAGQ